MFLVKADIAQAIAAFFLFQEWCYFSRDVARNIFTDFTFCSKLSRLSSFEFVEMQNFASVLDFFSKTTRTTDDNIFYFRNGVV
jgi:hypothetical protein